MPSRARARARKSEKHSAQVGQAEDLVADRLPELIENLIRLANGVYTSRGRRNEKAITDPDQLAEIKDDRLYLTPPDRQANEYLVNIIMGKLDEARDADVSRESKSAQLVAIVLKALAQYPEAKVSVGQALKEHADQVTSNDAAGTCDGVRPSDPDGSTRAQP